jgi:hypothetical protein
VTGSANGPKKADHVVSSNCCGESKERPQPKKGMVPVIRITHEGVRIDGQEDGKLITETGVVDTEKPRDIDHPRREEPAIVRIRLNICRVCNELVKDAHGEDMLEPIKRIIDDRTFCGGCDVEKRAQWVQATCPRRLWGPGNHFESEVLPVYVQTNKEPVPATLDYIGPARIADGNAMDFAGIGDTMMQGVIAQALQRVNVPQGIDVRFTTVPQRMSWAEFSTCGKMPVLDVTDDQRRVGEFAAHSSPLRMVEMDATCEMHGWNRMQFVAKQFDLPFEEVERWEVKMEPDRMERAAEFLKVPKSDGRPVAAVVPFANSSMRQWPLRHFHHLIERLKKQGFAVFVIDAPRPKGHMIYRIPVRRFQSDDPHFVAAVVKQSDILISNDSGMAHLAGFVGTKALGICAVTRGSVVFGGWPSVEVVQAPGSCTGCSWYRDNGWKHWCSWGCDIMSDLKPRDVEMRALGLMGK